MMVLMKVTDTSLQGKIHQSFMEVNLNYCINTGAARYQLPCINGNKSRVLIREFS